MRRCIGAIWAVVVGSCAPAFVPACTPAETQTAVKDVAGGIELNADLCTVLEETVSDLPDYVILECAIAGVANQVTKVYVPRSTWVQAKARAAAKKAQAKK